jgi:hypothetical protein
LLKQRETTPLAISSLALGRVLNEMIGPLENHQKVDWSSFEVQKARLVVMQMIFA